MSADLVPGPVLDPLDTHRSVCLIIHTDDTSADDSFAFCRLIECKVIVDHIGNDFIDISSENTIIGAAHPGIGNKRTSVDQSFISRLNMGMCPDESSQTYLNNNGKQASFSLVASRMEINDDDIRMNALKQSFTHTTWDLR